MNLGFSRFRRPPGRQADPAPDSPVLLRIAVLWVVAMLLNLNLAWMLTASAAPAAAGPTAGQAFDHLATGFVLNGAHAAERCESCHLNGIFKGTPKDCASCHQQGSVWARGHVVKPATHLPTLASCDSCHNSRSFAGARFQHSGLAPGSCQTCHNGRTSSGKPANHWPTTASCDSCHTSQAWTPAKAMDHSSFNRTTNCLSCHNGSTATGKPANHMPVNLSNCLACHNTRSWRPTTWNHTQVIVTAQCSSCHSGAYPPADGRPATHVPYTLVAAAAAANCDSCHRSGFGSWAGARFHANVSVSAQCASCHTGNYLGAVGKPATAIHSGVSTCESCHNTAAWSGARVDHASFNASTNCASCHNGSTASAKPASHMPTGSAGCAVCHNSNAWKPSKWNHTQTTVTNQCGSCHTGSYPPADGRPANHVPYALVAVAASANCDSCHKAGYASWAGARFHANYSVSAQCASCHTGNYLNAVGKPATTVHNGVTQCENCHKSTTSWAAKFGHSATNAVGTGTCDTCHNGASATGKPANHLPIQVSTARCDSCHRSQAAWTTAVSMNHSAVSGQACKTCHNSSYSGKGADIKPANHIPEAQLLNGAAMDCAACHTSTSSWGSQRMNHNASMGGGAGWCKACHASGTQYLGDMDRKALNHEAKGRSPTDCSESGCHRPLGNKGSTYVKWE